MLPYMGEEMEVYRVLLGKPEGRRPLGRPRRRWVDYIRMDLQEVNILTPLDARRRHSEDYNSTSFLQE